ncbi:MAG: hypothetical protein GC150_09775 [Rhizobiales bacterium]|nr:hypothetical protein [Hyphomicrobiales bacterium]
MKLAGDEVGRNGTGALWRGVERAGAAVPIALVVLLAAIANGLVVRVLEEWSLPGRGGLLTGIGPFELVAVAVASLMIIEARGAGAPPERFGWAEVMVGLALLVPSSAASWGVVLAYGGLASFRARGEARHAYLLLSALAVAALWSSLGVKLLAGPLTAFDAGLVGWLLEVCGTAPVVTGHVVTVAGDHRLIVLSACSSLAYAPQALVAVCAVALMGGRPHASRLLTAIAGVTLLLILANTARLAVMALSAEQYAFAHGPIGANLFDGLMVFSAIAAGWWSSRA